MLRGGAIKCIGWRNEPFDGCRTLNVCIFSIFSLLFATQEDGYDYNYDQTDDYYGQVDQWPRAGDEPLYYNSRPNKESRSIR